MPHVTEICEECDAYDDMSGRASCKYIGVFIGDHWSVSCCGLTRRQMDPAQGCANPATPNKWDGAERPKAPDTPLPVMQSSALEGSYRACLGHIDEPPCPMHGDAWMCNAVGRSVAPELKRPTGCCVVNKKPIAMRRANCQG